jgi:hypothetical protein
MRSADDLIDFLPEYEFALFQRMLKINGSP